MSPLERMDYVDAAFFGVDSEATPQVIAALCILDRPPNLATLQSYLSRALTHFPRLKQKVVFRPQLAWRDDLDFQLSDHIEVVRAPNLRDESELLAEVNQLIRATPSLERPPWRLVVITNDRDRCCLVFCLHHALADGVRVLNLLQALSSETPEPLSNDCAVASDETASVRVPSLFRRLADAARCAKKLLAEKLKSPGASPLNGDASGERCVTLLDVRRADVIQVMRHYGGSFHDVLFTLVAGAVRRYHDACGVPGVDLRLVVPMSVPPRSGKGGLGNHLVISALTLPVSEPDLTTRLQRVHELFERMKSDGTIGAYAFLANAIHRLIPRRFHRRIWESMLRETNFVCTILLGSESSRYIGGARIERVYGLPAPVIGHGVAFSFVSYAGTVCAAIVTDANIVGNPSHLKEHLASEFKALLTRAVGETNFAHPLLGQVAFSSAGESLFQSTLGSDSAPFLAQHRVYDTPTLPAGGLIEMALAASAEAVRQSAVTIENMTFDRPLKLSLDGRHEVHTTVVPEDDGEFSFQISSRDEQHADVWSPHAEGWIKPAHDARIPERINLAALQADCSQPVDIDAFYQTLRQREMELGGPLRSLRRLWRGPAQALGEIAMSSNSQHDTTSYQFHPTLIEACLQVALAALTFAESTIAMFPSRLDRLRFYRRPDSRFWAHASVHVAARDRTIDLLVFNRDGGAVASVEGLRCREIEESEFRRSPGEPVDFVSQWRVTEQSHRHDLIAAHVRAQVGRVLGCSTTRHIRLEDKFIELGIDSMIATEVKSRLETTLGRPLPANVVFEYPTLSALAEFLVGRLSQTDHASQRTEGD